MWKKVAHGFGHKNIISNLRYSASNENRNLLNITSFIGGVRTYIEI